MNQRYVYLDHAAATPVDPGVMTAMEPYFSDIFYNPSANYSPAREAKDAIISSLSSLAQVLGAKPSEIVITSGGTESNNLAIHGIMSQFPGTKILASSIEHESVLEPTKQYRHDLLPVNEQGVVRVNAAQKMIGDDVVLLSVMYANNEVGSVQSIRELAACVNTVRKERKAKGNKTPIYFHVDACQAPQYLDLKVHRLGVDMMTVNSGKIHGPKQVGLLYVSAKTKLAPQISGGGQQQARRSGTENVPGIVGFAHALAAADKNRKADFGRVQKLRQQLESALMEISPQIVVNGPRNKRLPNNLHVTIPGIDNERLMYQLDEHGILVATGSACNASSDVPSHVLRAMGRSDDEIRSSLRFTLGRSTKSEDIDYCIEVFSKLLA